MSVDMEQAEPFGDMGRFDQEAYHLDLDADADGNDIDLQLGTFETEVQYQTSSTDPDNGVANQADDIEIGFDEDNVMGDDDHDEEAPESNHDHETSADVDREYGDEIGYDDDEGGGDDGATGTATEADPSAPQTVSDESEQGDRSRETNHEGFSLDQSYDDASLHEEHAGQGNEKDVAILNGSIQVVDDTDLAAPLASHELEHPAPSNMGVEQIDGASVVTPVLPYVEVHYKETHYSLFGTPEDDPDSYFLSEPKYLDIPLSEFLAAIRHVVEDELLSHDELSIRIPSLSLEFSERSRESFLRAHSFREIYDCWTRLFFDEAEESSYLVFHLVVCPDPEHHFAQLLAQAAQPRLSGLLEGSGEDSESQEAISFVDGEKDDGSTENYTEANTGNFEDNFEDVSAAVSKADPAQPAVEGHGYETHGYVAHEGHDEEGDSGEAVADEQQPLPPSENSLDKEEEGTSFEEYPSADGDEEEDEDGNGAGDEDENEDHKFPEADNDVPLEIGAEDEDGDILADVEVTATGEAEVSVVGVGVESTSEFYGKLHFSSSQLTTPDILHFPAGPFWDMIDYSDDGDDYLLLDAIPASTTQPRLVFGPQNPKLSDPQIGDLQCSLVRDSVDESITSSSPFGSKRKPESGMYSAGRPVKKAKLDARVGEDFFFTSFCHYQTPERPIGAACDESPFSTPDLSFGSDSSPFKARSKATQKIDDPHSSTVAVRELSDELSREIEAGSVLLAPDGQAGWGAIDLPRFLDFDFDLNLHACWDRTNTFTQDEEINIELGEDPSFVTYESATGLDSHDDTHGRNGHRDDESPAPTDRQESNHTSATSTVEGDEIDYDDNLIDDESLSMNPDNHQRPDPGVEDGDEIDWRNDEDEEEAAVLATADSPSSVSAKRSRTDDADHSVDGAGMGTLSVLVTTRC